MNQDQQPVYLPSENLQVAAAVDVQSLNHDEGISLNDQPPSLRAVRPFEISQLSSGTDHYGYANGQPPSTLNVRPLNNSQVSGIGEYDASAQPLSSGAVRPLENSQISGAGDHYASGQPPSTGDVRPLNNSQSETGAYENPNQVAVTSSIAPKFKLRKFRPNIFQRDNNEY